MPRLRRTSALALAAAILVGIVLPSGAAVAGPVECEYRVAAASAPVECPGGGGGGSPTVATTTSVSAPAVAPYDAVTLSATTDPAGSYGTYLFSVGSTTQEALSTTPYGSSTTMVVPSTQIGQTLGTSASFAGQGGYYDPSSGTGSPVYIYGSKTISGSVQQNGIAAPGAPVALVNSAGTVVATTTAGSNGSFTVGVEPTTVAEAQAVYSVRATISGVNYFYNGASPSATQIANATKTGPTQWLPGTRFTINGTSAPVWPTTGVTTLQSIYGQPFSAFLSATSNVPVTYSIASGILPAGLSLNPTTGEISGTPTEFVSRGGLTFTASNGYRTAVSGNFGIRVDAKTAIAYSSPVVAPYGGWPVTVTVTSNVGVPAGAVTIKGWQGNLTNGSISFNLYGAPEWIGTSQDYTANYYPTSGTSAYLAGTAPASVYLYGTNAANGVFRQNGVVMPEAKIELQTAAGATLATTTTDANGRYSVAVTAPTTIAEAQATYLLKATAPNGSVGYYKLGGTSATVAGATLTGPTQWRPSATFQAFTMVSNPVFTDSTLSTPRVGTPYNDGVLASDPARIYYTISAGALPAGLSLDSSTGAITGTPTSMATATFTLRAYTVSIGNTDIPFTITPLRAGILPSFTDSTLGTIVTGTPVNDGVSAAGDPTITYSITAGDLPTGLELNATTGAITGTTYSTASYSVTIKAANEFGSVSTTLAGTPLRNTVASVTAPATAPYSAVVVGAGASSTAGTPTGSITLTSGSTSVTQSLVDGSSQFTHAGLLAQVGSTIGFTATYGGDGTYYGSTATGSTYLYGTNIVTGVVTSNGLPLAGAKVHLLRDGQLVIATGTDAAGRYTFTVDADTLDLATAVYSIVSYAPGGGTSFYDADSVATAANPVAADATVSGPTQWRTGQQRDIHFVTAPVWSDTTLATPREGTVYTDGVAATTAGGDLQYEVSAGVLPAGLGLNGTTGAITGTPTSQDVASFTVRAFTEYGSVSQAFTITPLRPGIVPTFTDETLGGFAVAVEFEDGVEATGDPDIEYSIDGIVPAGIGISPTTGAITGVPLYSGPYNFTVTASNEFGSAELTFTGWVDAVPVANVELGFTAGATIDQTTMTIAAEGLLEGSEYTLTMYSTPRVLFSGTVDQFRSFSNVVNLPADTPVGAHRLELRAIAADGTVLTANAYFTLLENGRIGAVSADGPLVFTPVTAAALAFTGIQPELPLALAAMMLLAGLVLARRRRHA